MKKTWAVMGTAVAVSAMIFTGCGSNNTTTGTDTTQESENTDTAATDTPAAEDSKGGDFSGLISPISREEGSGTRGAFIELFGIETKDTDGNKIDNTTDTAEITNSTSVMMTTVAGNEYAIGYVSLGSLLVYVVFVAGIIIMGQNGQFTGMSQANIYEMYVLAILLAILAYYKHWPNILRLIHGNENKTYLKKKKA